MRANFVKTRVKIYVYPHGSHVLFQGPRCIDRNDEKGTIRGAKNALNPHCAPVEN
jgi:hypothetical protein